MNPLQTIPAPRPTSTPAVPLPKRIHKRKPTTQLTLQGFVATPSAPETQNTIETPPILDPQLSQTTETDTHLANTPPDNLPEPRQPHVSLQRPLHIDPTNAPWGDALQYLKTHDHFRVLSKNISTLNTQNLDMQAIATELQSCDTSIFLAQETNIPWNPSNINTVRSHCQNILRHQKLAVSSSTDSANGTHQPGGTLTLAIGKWASRIIKWGSDEPLGRWSYLELAGQHGMRLIVVSTYRVCPQPFDATTTTVTAQQTRILLQQGVPNPNPREQFITDLIQQITTWRQHHKEVLIGMDANENIDDPQSKIMRLFNETDLIDLHYHRHPAATKPATHQRGSHPIDIMIGSPLLASTLTHAWILPFGEPALIKGDHRLLGLDFNADALFGSRPSLPSQGPLRGVNSRHEQHVHQFCTRVVKQCNRFRLAERTSTLFEQAILAPPDLSELDAIDDTLTKILIRSDKQCRPLSSTPWSTKSLLDTPLLVPHLHRKENRTRFVFLPEKHCPTPTTRRTRCQPGYLPHSETAQGTERTKSGQTRS